MEVINVNELTTKTVGEAIKVLVNKRNKLNEEAKSKLNAEIIKLSLEKNKLNKRIYTNKDIADITGVATATVKKILVEYQSEAQNA